MPAGAPIRWDCHAHAFGPADRFPPIAERAYDPRDAAPEGYRAEAHAAGLDGLVWVQPSIYGADNAAILAALDAGGTGTRAVIAPPASAEQSALRDLHARGVRGLRLNLVSKGGNTLASLAPFRDALRLLGWHVAAFLDASGDALDEVVGALDVPIVLDHFGWPGGRPLPTVDAFRGLFDHLHRGQVWVKLSAPYQICAGAPDCPAAAALARALLAANPDRVLFGSNWPHVGQRAPLALAPLVEATQAWIRSAGIDPDRVFGTNADALYR